METARVVRHHDRVGSRVLVAEDDPQQAELIRLYLEREKHTVTVLSDGREALETILATAPDLVLLDVMLPGLSGTDVCRLVRKRSDVPVLMITARSTEDDLVLGLDAGADDYVTKPYSPRELMARVRTLLRRTRAEAELLTVGPIEIDLARHRVRVDGAEIETTPGEFRLLQAMAEHAEHTLTRRQLLEQLHGDDRYVTTRTIDVHVMNLRRKVEPEPNAPRHLLTVYGVGYRLSAGPA
jgi:two-component system, OmpR family, alkaline phosphatase synthesis response regulator PhoP